MPHESDLASSPEMLLPWRRAESLHDLLVLWIPCRFQDMPDGQRAWLSLFLDRWLAVLTSEHGLGEEVFMQVETIQKEKKLADGFYANLMNERPLIGRSISSQQEEPKGAPTEEEIELLIKGKAKYDYHAMSASRACWFRGGDTGALRATYLGFGGMTILLIPQPEENKEDVKQMRQMISSLKLPAFLRKEAGLVALMDGLDPADPLGKPLFIRNHPATAHLNAIMGPQKRNPQKQLQRMMFGQKTKEVFGNSLKTDPAYHGISFLLPRFSSAEIFHSTVEERASWFQLFDVYVRESPEDDGILLLTKYKFLPEIVEVVASLRNDGYIYWEG